MLANYKLKRWRSMLFDSDTEKTSKQLKRPIKNWNKVEKTITLIGK